MTNKTKHHGKKKHSCCYCLQCFSSSKVLQCHVNNCLAINHEKVLLSEEGEYTNIQNFQRLEKVPFIFFMLFRVL